MSEHEIRPQTSVVTALRPRRFRVHPGVRPTHQCGAAAVEFALVLPMLLALLLGTVDMGLMLYDKAVITHASREGARAGIVLRNPKLSNAQITHIVQQHAQANLISLQSTDLPQVTVLQSSPAAYPHPRLWVHRGCSVPAR